MLSPGPAARVGLTSGPRTATRRKPAAAVAARMMPGSSGWPTWTGDCPD